jgi:hypothetical protein
VRLPPKVERGTQRFAPFPRLALLMSVTDTEALPPLEVSLAQALAAKVSDIITAAANATPGRKASAESKKLVARRVPPSWLSKYELMDEYGFVIWDEAMTILDRILVYPFTASYRKYLLDAPKEVIGAWQFHSHSLRVGELYIVFDRTVALLEFLNVVGRDCGLAVTDCRKSFDKTFKKTFHRRLRERHRLVHAHERPSMTSRIIDLSGGKWAGDKDESLQALMKLLADMLPKLTEASEAAGRTAPKTPQEVEAMHEWGAQQEARQMLKLVGEALLATLNDPSVAAGAAPQN